VRATRRDESGRLFVLFKNSDVELAVSRAYAQRFRQM
jgi:DNA-binding LytR/AlgR family response regulator